MGDLKTKCCGNLGEIEVREFDRESERDVDLTIEAYEYLRKNGIETMHYKKVGGLEIEVENLETIPVDYEFKQRQIEAYDKEYKIKAGIALESPDLTIIYYDVEEYKKLRAVQVYDRVELARKISNTLVTYFACYKIHVESGVIWFAKDKKGKVYIASNISPEMFELWDKETGKPFDNKDEIYARILA